MQHLKSKPLKDLKKILTLIHFKDYFETYKREYDLFRTAMPFELI